MNHVEEDGQIDVLDVYDWSDGDHETEPTFIEPESVRIPLITNAAYASFVSPSEPIVECGDGVTEGDVIAVPGEGISNTQHASISGDIAEITDTHIVIERSK
jgi:Na+-translocating ferredoxin:NAD+ oxidoreductase RnfC subunit